ncbi:MAG TPA: hypothetical protein VGK67_37115 [Myxococcales bacterium]|jgi:hypothetical protein
MIRTSIALPLLLLLASGCADGHRSSLDAGPAPDAAAGPDAAGCPATLPRAPLDHRPAGTECPPERGPQTSTPSCTCPADGGFCPCSSCAQDSDCTAGTNGRCGRNIPPPVLECTYDECFRDSDCAGAGPCQCRRASSSSAPNRCIRGAECTLDSDCGPGGFCSPSVLDVLCACFSAQLCPDAGSQCYVGSPDAEGTPPGPGWTAVPCVCGDSCGHGYFCHTGCDACIDDADCAGAETCNYSVPSGRWECSAPACPPGFTPDG